MTRDMHSPNVTGIHFRADAGGLSVTIEVYRPSPLGRPVGIVPTSRDVPEDIRAALTEWLADGSA